MTPGQESNFFSSRHFEVILLRESHAPPCGRVKQRSILCAQIANVDMQRLRSGFGTRRNSMHRIPLKHEYLAFNDTSAVRFTDGTIGAKPKQIVDLCSFKHADH